MTKYNNKRVNVNGIWFDSMKEGQRYCQLITMEKAGEIKSLSLQPKFVLAEAAIIQGRKKPALRYIADFYYIENGREIVEDVKGVLTAVYKIKRHLMKTVHGIDIKET